MRIAFITFEYPPGRLGGAGVYAKRLTEELEKAGNDVYVFTPSTDEEGLTKLNGVSVYRVKTNKALRFIAPQFWLKTPAIIRKLHKQKRFDLVHINDASYSFIPARIIDVPHVVTIHHLVKDTEETFKKYGIDKGSISSETSKIVQGIQKRAIRSTDKIISVSKYTKKKILEYYPVPNEKISVVYNGMDLGNKIPGDHTTFIRKKLRMIDNEKLLLFVGRIDDPRKGLSVLLDAMTTVKKTFPYKLVIVGSGDKKALMEKVRLLEIKRSIAFVGFVSQTTLEKYYSSCDVFVCPSLLEGFGFTVLEAIKYGKPVIASRVGGIPEILEKIPNVLLVTGGSPASLSKALNEVLSKDNLPESVLPSSMAKFDWALCAKGVSKVYLSGE